MPHELRKKLLTFKEGPTQELLLSIFTDLEENSLDFDLDDYITAAKVLDPKAEYIDNDRELYREYGGQTYPLKVILFKIAVKHGYAAIVTRILQRMSKDEAALMVNDNTHINGYSSAYNRSLGIVCYNNTPLMYAAANLEIIQILVNFGANLNFPIGYNNLLSTVLEQKKPNIEIVRKLLELGANVNFYNHGSRYPLPAIRLAISSENLEVVRLLTDSGVDGTMALSYVINTYERELDNIPGYADDGYGYYGPNFNFSEKTIYLLLAYQTKNTHLVTNNLVNILYTSGYDGFNTYLSDKTRIIPLKELQEARGQFKYTLKMNPAASGHFLDKAKKVLYDLDEYIRNNHPKATFFQKMRNRFSIFAAENLYKKKSVNLSIKPDTDTSKEIPVAKAVAPEKNINHKDIPVAAAIIKTDATGNSSNIAAKVEVSINLPMAPTAPIIFSNSINAMQPTANATADLENQLLQPASDKKKKSSKVMMTA